MSKLINAIRSEMGIDSERFVIASELFAQSESYPFERNTELRWLLVRVSGAAPSLLAVSSDVDAEWAALGSLITKDSVLPGGSAFDVTRLPPLPAGFEYNESSCVKKDRFFTAVTGGTSLYFGLEAKRRILTPDHGV